MRSKFLQDVVDETPNDVKVFARIYADLLVSVGKVMKDNNKSPEEQQIIYSLVDDMIPIIRELAYSINEK